jgi:hypothetical protein
VGQPYSAKPRTWSEGRAKVWHAAVEAGGNVAGLGVRGEGNLQCDYFLRWMWMRTLIFFFRTFLLFRGLGLILYFALRNNLLPSTSGKSQLCGVYDNREVHRGDLNWEGKGHKGVKKESTTNKVAYHDCRWKLRGQRITKRAA